MLSPYIDVFKGFFSRDFWFSAFLPVAVFAFLHLVVAAAAFEERIPLLDWLTLDATKLAIFPAVFAALVVVAYSLRPLTPLLRGLLDASLVPQWMYDALHREHEAEARLIRERLDIARNMRPRSSKMKKRWLDAFSKARQRGNTLDGVIEKALIVAAERRVAELQRQLKWQNSLIGMVCFRTGQRPDQPHATVRARIWKKIGLWTLGRLGESELSRDFMETAAKVRNALVENASMPSPDFAELDKQWADRLQATRSDMERLLKAFKVRTGRDLISSKVELKALKKAGREGNALKRIGSVKSIEDVERRVGRLRRELESFSTVAGRILLATGELAGVDAVKRMRIWMARRFVGTPGEVQFTTVADKAIQALEANATKIEGNASAAQKKWGGRLDRARAALEQLLLDGAREAEHQHYALHTRYGRIAVDNPQATRLGDARYIVENYSSSIYGADFDYIWPRLRFTLPQEGAEGSVGSFNDRLMGAESQVNFALLSLALSVTLPAVWLPLLVWKDGSVLLFLLIGFAGPLLAAFLYRMVVESQLVFGEAMKAAIDRHRFDLLKALSLPLPSTRSSERALWHALRVAEQAPGSPENPLTYQHR